MNFDRKNVPESSQEAFGRSKRAPGGVPRSSQGPLKDPPRLPEIHEDAPKGSQNDPQGPQRTPSLPENSQITPQKPPRAHTNLILVVF
jgi:hypothetical protein